MNRRVLGSIVISSALAFMLMIVFVVLGAGNSRAQAQAQGAGSKTADAAAVPGRHAGAWADIAPFPTVEVRPTPGTTLLRLKRAGAAAYPPNGKMYVLGGRHGIDGEDLPLLWIWEYTPGDPGTWVRKNAHLEQPTPPPVSTPTPTSTVYPPHLRFTANMAVAVLTDTTGPMIYAIGGTAADSIPTNTTRVYNPVADTISTLPSDPWPIPMADGQSRAPGGWAVLDNKLYIFGGFTSRGAGAVFSEAWRFDPMAPAGTRWSQIASLNLARGFIAGAALDGKIYAIGGDTWTAGTRTLVPVNNVEQYDPATNTWTPVASLPAARGDMGAWAYDTGTGYEISGQIAVAGGFYPTPVADGYLYDPGSNSWSTFPSMVHATRNYGYAQLNGYLYAFGGYDFTTGFPNGANWNQRYDATQAQGTPTSTVTGTPPTATRTNTVGPSTNTPTASPTACGPAGSYTIATATGTIVPGTTDTGNHGDDVVTAVTLPFPFRLYGVTYNSANVSSNGNMQFVSTDTEYFNECLPRPEFGPTIFPYWDDQLTSTTGTCAAGPCGIWTSITGTAPNRIFNIEWRTYYFSGAGSANYEIRLYEANVATDQRFEVVYGAISQTTTGTGGVQNQAGTQFTQHFCNTAVPAAGTVAIYTASGGTCGTPGTATSVPATATRTATITPTSVASATRTSTSVPPTITMTPTITPTVGCAPLNRQVNIQGFAFVPQNITISVGSTVQWTNFDEAWHDSHSTGNWAGPPLEQGDSWSYTFTTVGTYSYFCTPHPWMTGTITVIGGCTPTATNTVVPQPTACPITFLDVPNTNEFYANIRCLACRGIVSGYADGTFRPNNPVTRGQLAKMVSNSAGFNEPVSGQTFQDVPPTHTFYEWIERLTTRGHMTGYPCTPGSLEPCVAPNNRPYFRPQANATRGQTSKIVANAAGFNEPVSGQTFQDVPTNHTFYEFIQRLANRNVMQGYPCGGVGEPCEPPTNRPYFRPGNDVTRGQSAKIVANSFFPNCQTP